MPYSAFNYYILTYILLYKYCVYIIQVSYKQSIIVYMILVLYKHTTFIYGNQEPEPFIHFLKVALLYLKEKTAYIKGEYRKK